VYDVSTDKWVPGTVASSTEWGDITGTLSAQTDLQAVLDAKQDDLDVPSLAEAQAGVATIERVWTAERVVDAAEAHWHGETSVSIQNRTAFTLPDRCGRYFIDTFFGPGFPIPSATLVMPANPRPGDRIIFRLLPTAAFELSLSGNGRLLSGGPFPLNLGLGDELDLTYNGLNDEWDLTLASVGLQTIGNNIITTAYDTGTGTFVLYGGSAGSINSTSAKFGRKLERALTTPALATFTSNFTDRDLAHFRFALEFEEDVASSCDVRLELLSSTSTAMTSPTVEKTWIIRTYGRGNGPDNRTPFYAQYPILRGQIALPGAGAGTTTPIHLGLRYTRIAGTSGVRVYGDPGVQPILASYFQAAQDNQA
jgi:hypothetical protein